MNKIFNCQQGLIVAKVHEAKFKNIPHTNGYFKTVVNELRFTIEFKPEFRVVGLDTIDDDYFDGNIMYLSFRFGKRDDLSNLMIQFGLEPTEDIEKDCISLLEVLKEGTDVVLFTNDNGDWRNYVAPYADHGYTSGAGKPMLHFMENHLTLGESHPTKKSSAFEVYEMFKTLVAAEVTTE